MVASVLYSIKKAIWICDCLVTRKKRAISFRGDSYSFLSTHWWDSASQDLFDQEIVPYFEALEDFRAATVVDVGAATGHFAIVASKIFSCMVHAFEPAVRQRILLSRNAGLNHVNKISVEPFGLWNRSESIPFRTIGAESSFAPVSRLQGILEFPEKARVMALDEWVGQKQIEQIDLIKIDAEGAEIEILEGATSTLRRFRPRLLVQAYHMRNGVRTFERCARLLADQSYRVEEHASPSGLLYARPA